MPGRSMMLRAFAALAMFPLAAHAQSLKIVEVNAPAINCVFAQQVRNLTKSLLWMR
jgi:hypothetical protein